jgi:anti-sigma regulatory factor (Ser/Thr protein kinase)
MVALSSPVTTPDRHEMRWFRVEGPSTVAAARNAARAMASALTFPEPRAEQLAVAVSEAVSNLHKHARDGSLLLRVNRDTGLPGIELVTIDAGPGVRDLGKAVQDGQSSAGTLGIGLGAIRRMADLCELYSVSGHGTTLVARFWPQPRQPVIGCAGLSRPITGEVTCGDMYSTIRVGSTLTGVLCDGLGHGPLAAAAASEALAAVAEEPAGDPAALLGRVHRRMSRTRGGAIAIAQIDGTTVRFAGLGNVAAWVIADDSRSGMVSVPGIAGHHARKLRQFEYPLPPHGAVVLHSDGLSSRWDSRELPGLASADPLVTAAALLAEAGTRRDDASVLVLKP